MANPEHVAVLRKGAKTWNEWRRQTVEARGSFAFKSDGLGGHADVESAYHLWAVEGTPDLRGSSFAGADLRGVNLGAANLVGIDLSNAKLGGIDLSGADARRAKLRGADLSAADLSRAVLDHSDLRDVQLDGATLRDCSLDGVDLTNAHIGRVAYDYEALGFLAPGYTCIANVDLSNVRGLDSVRHYGRSSVGVDVLLKSRGRIPSGFLRGCGIPDALIVSLGETLAGIRPSEFFSFFISYSHSDRQFARKLHDVLQVHGIRCWLDEKQLRPGDNIYDQVDHGIQHWDKLLLCCSKESLSSWWVDGEIAAAFEKERRLDGKTGARAFCLIPLDLDGYLLSGYWQSGKAAQIRQRLAADFIGWETNRQKFVDQAQEVIRALRADDVDRAPPPLSKL